MFYTFLSNSSSTIQINTTILTNFIIQLFWVGWIPTMKSNQLKITFGQKSGFVKLLFEYFCFKVLSYKKYFNNLVSLFLRINKIFCLFQDFQQPLPKYKDFPGPRNFFPSSRTFQDFQGPWQPWFKSWIGIFFQKQNKTENKQHCL